MGVGGGPHQPWEGLGFYSERNGGHQRAQTQLSPASSLHGHVLARVGNRLPDSPTKLLRYTSKGAMIWDSWDILGEFLPLSCTRGGTSFNPMHAKHSGSRRTVHGPGGNHQPSHLHSEPWVWVSTYCVSDVFTNAS